MLKSTTLRNILESLTRDARSMGLTDTDWAAQAALRKETLSRLRHRDSCDFQTLDSLAKVVAAQIRVLPADQPEATEDGHFPAIVHRHYENRLVKLCASKDRDAHTWARLGPRFFMAGLAVMMASATGADRRGLLALAEMLHPGASEASVFTRWLERSPVRPSRFFPLLAAELKRAA